MAAEYRGLRFDPAPGNPEAVGLAGDRLGRAARNAAGAAPAIEAAVRLGDSWSGGASAAFSAALGGAPAELGRAGETLRAAAEVLDEWAATLRANQRTADRLDRQARELRRAIEHADEDVASARAALQVAIGTAARTAEADHAAALARQAQLQIDLDKVLAAARVLERDHLAAAGRVVERLRLLEDPPSGGAEAAGELVRPDELFGRVARTAGTLSVHAGELALTLFGGAGGQIGIALPTGAAGRFAAAITAQPGRR